MTFEIEFNPLMGRETLIALDIDEAKKYVDERLAYNQKDAIIYNTDGQEITRRRWWGVTYDPCESDCIAPIDFGDYGYYDDWD